MNNFYTVMAATGLFGGFVCCLFGLFTDINDPLFLSGAVSGLPVFLIFGNLIEVSE